MISITKKRTQSGEEYYNFVLVKNDTGVFKATPKVDGQEYELQDGDTIDFKISKSANSQAFVTIVADSDNNINITKRDSKLLTVGDYYCDITLNYANGNQDTFIKIPTNNNIAVSNFHVVYGV